MGIGFSCMPAASGEELGKLLEIEKGCVEHKQGKKMQAMDYFPSPLVKPFEFDSSIFMAPDLQNYSRNGFKYADQNWRRDEEPSKNRTVPMVGDVFVDSLPVDPIVSESPAVTLMEWSSISPEKRRLIQEFAERCLAKYNQDQHGDEKGYKLQEILLVAWEFTGWGDMFYITFTARRIGAPKVRNQTFIGKFYDDFHTKAGTVHDCKLEVKKRRAAKIINCGDLIHSLETEFTI